jgi:hypothetical protein
MATGLGIPAGVTAHAPEVRDSFHTRMGKTMKQDGGINSALHSECAGRAAVFTAQLTPDGHALLWVWNI